MSSNPHETEDLVTLTEETLNGKLHFCAVGYVSTKPPIYDNVNEHLYSVCPPAWQL